jgi:hypothetical protein
MSIMVDVDEKKFAALHLPIPFRSEEWRRGNLGRPTNSPAQRYLQRVEVALQKSGVPWPAVRERGGT